MKVLLFVNLCAVQKTEQVKQYLFQVKLSGSDKTTLSSISKKVMDIQFP